MCLRKVSSAKEKTHTKTSKADSTEITVDEKKKQTENFWLELGNIVLRRNRERSSRSLKNMIVK